MHGEALHVIGIVGLFVLGIVLSTIRYRRSVHRRKPGTSGPNGVNGSGADDSAASAT
jgi:hypothetical protein